MNDAGARPLISIRNVFKSYRRGGQVVPVLHDVSIDGLAVEMSGPLPDAIGDATVILNGSRRQLEVPCRAVYSRGSIGGVKLGLHVLDRATLARWMAERG